MTRAESINANDRSAQSLTAETRPSEIRPLRDRALWRNGAMALVLLLGPLGCTQSTDDETPGPGETVAPSGETVFADTCATCHEGGMPKAPHKLFLSLMAADSLYNAMDSGTMKVQAASLSQDEKQAVAEYLSGAKLGDSNRAPQNMCSGENLEFDLSQAPAADGWGFDSENTRSISGKMAGLSAEDVPRLKLKWAFGFPGATRARSQPMAAMGAVFVGSQDGTVYALDRETGCVRWTFRASAEVRTPVIMKTWSADNIPSAPTAYFSDLIARVYAVDALTGELKWSTKVDDHPNATITGSPALHDGRLYVPVSSLEVATAADPDYPCCTFRGSIVALDAETGDQIWKGYTIPEEPSRAGKTTAGTPIYAPSGAPIWNSPLIDAERGLIYAGTGENYSSPANDTSDALLAFRMSDGKLEWTRQTTEGDAWNSACMMPDKSNCPEEDGPDVDFGASTIKVTLANGKDVLLAGQKSGVVYALDLDDEGKILWQNQVGRGGIQGGVHFGMAYSKDRLFVPITDMNDKEAESYAWNIPGKPGIYALDPASGDMLWEHPADNICDGKKYCEPGISASITAIPGVVFAGHMDGRLRAYAAEDGKLLWEFETDEKVFPTVNSIPATGGSFGGSSGPLVQGGMLFANSGYGMYYHRPGNVLLAFSIEKAVEEE